MATSSAFETTATVRELDSVLLLSFLLLLLLLLLFCFIFECKQHIWRKAYE